MKICKRCRYSDVKLHHLCRYCKAGDCSEAERSPNNDFCVKNDVQPKLKMKQNAEQLSLYPEPTALDQPKPDGFIKRYAIGLGMLGVLFVVCILVMVLELSAFFALVSIMALTSWFCHVLDKRDR